MKHGNIVTAASELQTGDVLTSGGNVNGRTVAAVNVDARHRGIWGTVRVRFTDGRSVRIPAAVRFEVYRATAAGDGGTL